MNGHVIQNTSIAVDLWVKGKGKYVHFLTHCHADHMSGLTDSWKEPIYTSEFNVWMLKKFHKIQPSLLIELSIGETHVIKEANGHEFSVTLITANHCPGAVMFLFEGYFGTVLYTGDFRYHSNMLKNVQLERVIRNETLDVLYLDNTYASEDCVFPSRYKAGQEVISIIRNHPACRIHIGLPNLGKEQLLRRIALELNEPIQINEQRLEIVKKLNFEDVFTTDPQRSRIHVIKKSLLNVRYMTRKRAEDVKQIAILPSALFRCGNGKVPIPFSNSERHGIYVVAYSDHSCNSELYTFVSKLKPVKLIPIIKPVMLSGSKYFSYWEYLKTVHTIPRSLKMLCNKVKRTKSNYYVDVEGKDNVVDENEGAMAIRDKKKKKVDRRTYYRLRKRRIPRASDRKGVYFKETSSDDESSKNEFEDDIKMEEMLVTLPDSSSLTVKTPQTVKKNLYDIRVKLYDIYKDKSQIVKTCQDEEQGKLVDHCNQLRDDDDDDDARISSQYLENEVLALAQQCTSTLKDIFKQEPVDDDISDAATVIMPLDKPFQEEDIKDISMEIKEDLIDIKENISSDGEEYSSHSTEHSTYSVQVFRDDSLQRFLKRERESDDESFESRRRKRRKNSGSQSDVDLSQIECTSNESEQTCHLQGNTNKNFTNDVPELAPMIVNIHSLISNNTQHSAEVSTTQQSENLQTLNVTTENHELNDDIETLKKLALKEPVTTQHIHSNDQVSKQIPEKPFATADRSQNSDQVAKQIPQKLCSAVHRSQNNGQMMKQIPEKLCTAPCRSQMSGQVAEKPSVTGEKSQSSDQVAKEIHEEPLATAFRFQSNDQMAEQISQKSPSIAYESHISDQMTKSIYDKPTAEVCSDQVETSNPKNLITSVYSEQGFYTRPLSKEQILSSVGSTSESEDRFFSANEELDSQNNRHYSNSEDQFCSANEELVSQNNRHYNNSELSSKVPTGTQVKLKKLSGELEVFNNSITKVMQSHLSPINKKIKSSAGRNKIQCDKNLTSETERTNSSQCSSTNNITSKVSQRVSRGQFPKSNASKRITNQSLNNPSVSKRYKYQTEQKKISFINTCTSVNDSHAKSFLPQDSRIGENMQTSTSKPVLQNYWKKYPSSCVYDFLKISDETHPS